MHPVPVANAVAIISTQDRDNYIQTLQHQVQSQDLAIKMKDKELVNALHEMEKNIQVSAGVIHMLATLYI